MSIGLPGTGPGFARDAAPGARPDAARWRILAVLSLAELLGMSMWFAGTAAGPQLAERWHLTHGEAGWLTTIVQLGFVAGTAVAAVLNLADLVPARRYFAVAAVLAAASNATLLAAPSFAVALVCRFLSGFFLAGVYPPGMKMVATWFREKRGLAIGTLVGALGIGKASPYLVHAIGHAGVEPVIVVASANAVLAALLVTVAYRDGPYAFAGRPFAWSLVATVMRHRETRLAIFGYLGHMWELYAMWAWLPAFFAASLAARAAATGVPAAQSTDDLLAFGAIAVGSLGCLWGGWASARIGYARVVTISMALSGLCALGIGFAFHAPLPLLVAIAWIWGFFVVADSAQFSAMVTEAAPAHAVGTALTLQTSMGFLLTMATIQLLPVLVAAVGWPWTFPVLALGPVFGIAAIARLPRAPKPA
ncbi:MAG TPA: MFS transporter [Candidatus Eisenbacteria bacterium]|nr:MFS transporter [Candidatus Eisenbacteria bacterium]